jgi:DNA replication protein DnaC
MSNPMTLGAVEMRALAGKLAGHTMSECIALAKGVPFENPNPSMDAEKPKCHRCKYDFVELVGSKTLDDGTTLYICKTCKEHLGQLKEARDKTVAERTGRFLRDVPAIPVEWLDLQGAEFRKRVRSSALLKFAQQHDPDTHGSAVLLGPSGSGKTLAAVGLAHRLVAAVKKAPTEQAVFLVSISRWMTAHSLARARRQYSLGDGEAPAIAEAMDAPLLIIDELGFEPATEVLFEVVDARYAKRWPTIVTSGKTQVEFTERYGDALVRRLAGDGIGALVDVHAGAKGSK